MDHPLPPLGLFLQIKLKSLSLSQTHMESFQKEIDQRFQKLPHISHNQLFSPQEANFWQKRQCTSFDKTKALFDYFQISQVVADPFIALAFIFSPFGIKHQNGINFGPFNPIASPKSSIKSKWQ
jgi:hypothetical protein